MRMMGLCLLALITTSVFGSVKAHAQCYSPTILVCVPSSGGCHQADAPAFVNTGISGEYAYDGPEATCCGKPVPGMTWRGGYGCYITMTKSMRMTVARLAVHNRVLLVACSGGLIPYHDGAVSEQIQMPAWSANRAVSAYAGSLVTRAH